jgi:hypothetical protein
MTFGVRYLSQNSNSTCTLRELRPNTEPTKKEFYSCCTMYTTRYVELVFHTRKGSLSEVGIDSWLYLWHLTTSPDGNSPWDYFTHVCLPRQRQLKLTQCPNGVLSKVSSLRSSPTTVELSSVSEQTWVNVWYLRIWTQYEFGQVWLFKTPLSYFHICDILGLRTYIFSTSIIPSKKEGDITFLYPSTV